MSVIMPRNTPKEAKQASDAFTISKILREKEPHLKREEIGSLQKLIVIKLIRAPLAVELTHDQLKTGFSNL